MEVKEASAKYLRTTGYKQTEVGVIPEDWDVVALGKSLRRPPNYGINAPAISFDSRYPTYLRITDITEDGRFAEATKASVDHPASETYLLELGDLVFARTGASVGKSYLYNPKDGRLVFAGFLIRITPDAERLIPAFLSFFVQTRTYWNWVKVNSMRSGQPGINGREYASLPIPIPPTKTEQEAIAEALSDADALIESLEQLLAKKRHLKQGAMQELLTGKKRLPGFSGKWEVRQLAGSCELVTKGTTPTSIGKGFTDSGITFVKVESITSDGRIIRDKTAFIDEETDRLLKRSQLKKNDLLISIAGALGRVAIVDLTILPANTNQALAIARFKQNAELSIAYVFHYLGLEKIRRHVEGISVQGAQANLSLKNIAELPIEAPVIEEQTAIATILSDMDAELAALEETLAKARAIKQGMMQELLTGRIRLI